MLAIVDYGVGNLYSLRSSLQAIGEESIYTSDEQLLYEADRVLLPGVGAYAHAMNLLKEKDMVEVIRNLAKRGKPLFGVCLGMQLLFEKSFEFGEIEGLALLKGEVIPMKENLPPEYKIPHMGWNSLQLTDASHPLWKRTKQEDYVYFVHSYYASNCEDSIIATTDYGVEIPAAVAQDNIMACQFHPEKSGQVGLDILRSFCELGGNV